MICLTYGRCSSRLRKRIGKQGIQELDMTRNDQPCLSAEWWMGPARYPFLLPSLLSWNHVSHIDLHAAACRMIRPTSTNRCRLSFRSRIPSRFCSPPILAFTKFSKQRANCERFLAFSSHPPEHLTLIPGICPGYPFMNGNSRLPSQLSDLCNVQELSWCPVRL